MSLRVLSIGALPPSSPYTASIERCSISKAFLDVSYVVFGVPSKEPTLQVSLTQLP